MLLPARSAPEPAPDSAATEKLTRTLDRLRTITPNREAARSLGVSSRTLDDAARRLLERHGVHVAPALIARRMLADAARDEAGVSDVVGFAARAESTIRELMRAGLDMAALREDENPRVRRLAAVAVSYRAALQREGWIDHADVFAHATDLCRAEGSARAAIAVIGYPRLPMAERRFIDAYASEGSMVFLPLADAPLFRENQLGVEDFERWGWRVERPEVQAREVGTRLALDWIREATADSADRELQATAPTVADDARARAYPDLDAEVRGVLADVKRLLLRGAPADRVAVVARHERAYGPALLAVAEEYRIPFRVLYSVPLAETRFGAWLHAAFEILAADFPFEETARWLADPITGALDHATWSRARRARPSGEIEWRELGVALPPSSWPETAQRSAFVTALQRLLAASDVVQRAARWPREAAAIQAFMDGIRQLPDLERSTSLDAFEAEVSELLAVLSVAASPGHGGVELHTPLSLFGARVDHLFVVGAAEGHLPSPVRPDALLDPFERATLGRAYPAIEDVRAQARREEMSFWAMLQSASSQLTLTFPKLLGRNETLPSPYLGRLGLRAEDAPRPAICSWRELRRMALPEGRDAYGDDLLVLARHAHGVELRRESESPPGVHDGVTGIAYEEPAGGIGVSRLIDMASCPFKFWAKSILRLEEPAEAPAEFDYALRGTLYHETLHRAVEMAVEETGGSVDLRAVALEHLEAAFAESEAALEAERDVRLSAFPNWERDREEHITVLRNAIQGPDFMQPDARVLALESSFQGAWRGIRVRGRIDRVDHVPTGAVLVDYKSGASVSSKAKDAAGKATVDLQLPVYREGAEELLARLAPPGDAAVRDTFYYSVTKAKKISVTDAPEEELSRIAHDVREGWQAGAFPVDPDVDWSACRYCELDALCRKGPRLERKRRHE